MIVWLLFTMDFVLTELPTLSRIK